MSTPVVSLSYNSVSGEFTLKVTNVSKASYVLEYDWESENPEKPEEKITNTDALTNQVDANTTNVVQDTQLAGTKSNDDTFVHPASNGKLTVSASLPDGRTFEYQSTFKLTSTKAVKIIAEESSIKNATQGAVLGVTDTASQAAEMTTTSLKATTTAEPVTTTSTKTQTQMTNDPNNLTIDIPLPQALIGTGILGLLLIGGAVAWFINKRKTQTADTTQS